MSNIVALGRTYWPAFMIRLLGGQILFIRIHTKTRGTALGIAKSLTIKKSLLQCWDDYHYKRKAKWKIRIHNPIQFISLEGLELQDGRGECKNRQQIKTNLAGYRTMHQMKSKFLLSIHLFPTSFCFFGVPNLPFIKCLGKHLFGDWWSPQFWLMAVLKCYIRK